MSIELGKFNQLEVVKEVDFGVYLDGGEEGEILLPTRYVPEDCKIGDLLNVFLYLDMDERLIANALLRRVRDFAQVKGSGSIDTEIAQFALEALNIDKYGLDEIDNKILCTIIDKFKGGPVGITTIATALGEDAGTIEEVYEPFLIKEGFMKRTPRGREVTELAYKHLGRSLYNSQKTLFND